MQCDCEVYIIFAIEMILDMYRDVYLMHTKK
jgi:hypothetical protein